MDNPFHSSYLTIQARALWNWNILWELLDSTLRANSVSIVTAIGSSWLSSTWTRYIARQIYDLGIRDKNFRIETLGLYLDDDTKRNKPTPPFSLGLSYLHLHHPRIVNYNSERARCQTHSDHSIGYVRPSLGGVRKWMIRRRRKMERCWRTGSHTPLPQCNLFFSQLYNNPTPDLTILFPSNSSFFEEYHVVCPSHNFWPRCHHGVSPFVWSV